MSRARLLPLASILFSFSAWGYSLSGAQPLDRGQRALRLSGGIAAFVPEGAAGVPLLGGTLVPVLPVGGAHVGYGFGIADLFATYDTLAGFVHRIGAESRLQWLNAGRVHAAVALRLDYEMRGLKVKSVSFAGALRLGGDVRIGIALFGARLIAAVGFTGELLSSSVIGGESTTDARALLATYDLAAGLEWPWGKSDRFFLRAISRFSADPTVVTDRATISIEVGGGFPF